MITRFLSSLICTLKPWLIVVQTCNATMRWLQSQINESPVGECITRQGDLVFSPLKYLIRQQTPNELRSGWIVLKLSKWKKDLKKKKDEHIDDKHCIIQDKGSFTRTECFTRTPLVYPFFITSPSDDVQGCKGQLATALTRYPVQLLAQWPEKSLMIASTAFWPLPVPIGYKYRETIISSEFYFRKLD